MKVERTAQLFRIGFPERIVLVTVFFDGRVSLSLSSPRSEMCDREKDFWAEQCVRAIAGDAMCYSRESAQDMLSKFFKEEAGCAAFLTMFYKGESL